MKVSADVPPATNVPKHSFRRLHGNWHGKMPVPPKHDQHINGHNAEYPPKTGRVERLSAPVKCTENDTYRFYRKTKRHDIHQIGKHGVTHRLVKSFRVTYCNILYCIHILFYLYAIICISSFLRIVLMDENPTSCTVLPILPEYRQPYHLSVPSTFFPSSGSLASRLIRKQPPSRENTRHFRQRYVYRRPK